MIKNPYISARELSGIIGISQRKIKENISKLKKIVFWKELDQQKAGIGR